MGYKSGIEKAMNISADTGTQWVNGVDIFWTELKDNDASVPAALRKAIAATCGVDDTERIERAIEAFWITVRGVPRP